MANKSPETQKSNRRQRLYWGIFFTCGWFIANAAKLMGMMPPKPDTPYGRGSQAGSNIGNVIGFFFGPSLIAASFMKKDETPDSKESKDEE